MRSGEQGDPSSFPVWFVEMPASPSPFIPLQRNCDSWVLPPSTAMWRKARFEGGGIGGEKQAENDPFHHFLCCLVPGKSGRRTTGRCSLLRVTYLSPGRKPKGGPATTANWVAGRQPHPQQKSAQRRGEPGSAHQPPLSDLGQVTKPHAVSFQTALSPTPQDRLCDPGQGNRASRLLFVPCLSSTYNIRGPSWQWCSQSPDSREPPSRLPGVGSPNLHRTASKDVPTVARNPTSHLLWQGRGGDPDEKEVWPLWRGNGSPATVTCSFQKAGPIVAPRAASPECGNRAVESILMFLFPGPPHHAKSQAGGSRDKRAFFNDFV